MHASDLSVFLAVHRRGDDGLVDALPLGDVLLKDDGTNATRCVETQRDVVVVVLAGCLDPARAEVGDLLTEASENLDVGIGEKAVAVRGNVQEERCIAADRALPD